MEPERGERKWVITRIKLGHKLALAVFLGMGATLQKSFHALHVAGWRMCLHRWLSMSTALGVQSVLRLCRVALGDELRFGIFEPLPSSPTAFSCAMHSLSDCFPGWACFCVKFVVDELLIVTGWPRTIQRVHPITESPGEVIWDLHLRGASDRGGIRCRWRCFGKRGRRLIRVRVLIVISGNGESFGCRFYMSSLRQCADVWSSECQDVPMMKLVED